MTIHVFLDPDGTASHTNWLFVVIETPTGVSYETQCGGLSNDVSRAEGYLVPVNGLSWDPDKGHIDASALSKVFHTGRSCGTPDPLSPDLLKELEGLVSQIPFWTHHEGRDSHRGRLQIDDSRLPEIREAWVPVLTPAGPGILLWPNCD